MSAKSRIVIVLYVLGALSARADLDLSPTVEVKNMERVPMSHVVFHDGATSITYQPPRGWSVSGSHDSAALDITDHPQAKAYIQSAPRVRIPAFDDKALQLFQQNPRLLGLPRGAKDIQITAVTANPLVIDGHPTLEVDLNYSFFGQKCARSLILCDRKGAEVSFVLDSLAPDFTMLSAMFRRSLFSIENL